MAIASHARSTTCTARRASAPTARARCTSSPAPRLAVPVRALHVALLIAGWTRQVNVINSGYRTRTTDARRRRQADLPLHGLRPGRHPAHRLPPGAPQRRQVLPAAGYDALVHTSLAAGRRAKWSTPHLVVVPPRAGYSQYYQKLTVDRLGRLFVSCSYFSRRDPPATRSFRRFHHRMVLISEDAGPPGASSRRPTSSPASRGRRRRGRRGRRRVSRRRRRSSPPRARSLRPCSALAAVLLVALARADQSRCASTAASACAPSTAMRRIRVQPADVRRHQPRLHPQPHRYPGRDARRLVTRNGAFRRASLLTRSSARSRGSATRSTPAAGAERPSRPTRSDACTPWSRSASATAACATSCSTRPTRGGAGGVIRLPFNPPTPPDGRNDGTCASEHLSRLEPRGPTRRSSPCGSRSASGRATAPAAWPCTCCSRYFDGDRLVLPKPVR